MQLLAQDKGMLVPVSLKQVGMNSLVPFTTSDASVGNAVLGTDNFQHGTLYQRLGQTANVVDTLPTGAQMDIDYPNAAVGDSWMASWVNQGAFNQSMSNGVGFTVVGNNVFHPGATTQVQTTKTGVGTWTLSQYTDIAGISQSPQWVVRNATVGAYQLLVADMDADIQVRSGSIAAYADVLPTGVAMEAFPPFASMAPGTSSLVLMANMVAFARTLTAAAGFTVIGNLAGVLPVNSCIKCLINKIAVNSYSLEILG